MIPTDYNRILFFVLCFALAGLFPIAPAHAKASTFCTRLDRSESIFDDRLAKAETRLEAARNRHETTLVQQRETLDANTTRFREKWDGERQAALRSLADQAVTDQQKNTFQEFQTTLDNLISARRSAIDQATQVFRQAVDEAVDKRQDEYDNIIDTLTNTADEALNNARNLCAQNVDGALVEENFRIAMKAAREKFISDRKAVVGLAPAISGLAENLHETIQTATQTFDDDKTEVEETLDDVWSGENN